MSRPVLSDDPALAEIRTRIAMHQAFVHVFTSTCPLCVGLYADEELYLEAHLDRFVQRSAAA